MQMDAFLEILAERHIVGTVCIAEIEVNRLLRKRADGRLRRTKLCKRSMLLSIGCIWQTQKNVSAGMVCPDRKAEQRTRQGVLRRAASVGLRAKWCSGYKTRYCKINCVQCCRDKASCKLKTPLEYDAVCRMGV